jgi:hypothetical protein
LKALSPGDRDRDLFGGGFACTAAAWRTGASPQPSRRSPPPLRAGYENARQRLGRGLARPLGSQGILADEGSGSLLTTDEMDKPFVSRCAIFRLRGRPRGEERGVGWKLRQAA